MFYLLFLLLITLNRDVFKNYFTKNNNHTLNSSKFPNINLKKIFIIPYELEPDQVFHFFTVWNI